MIKKLLKSFLIFAIVTGWLYSGMGSGLQF